MTLCPINRNWCSNSFYSFLHSRVPDHSVFLSDIPSYSGILYTGSMNELIERNVIIIIGSIWFSHVDDSRVDVIQYPCNFILGRITKVYQSTMHPVILIRGQPQFIPRESNWNYLINGNRFQGWIHLWVHDQFHIILLSLISSIQWYQVVNVKFSDPQLRVVLIHGLFDNLVPYSSSDNRRNHKHMDPYSHTP